VARTPTEPDEDLLEQLLHPARVWVDLEEAAGPLRPDAEWLEQVLRAEAAEEALREPPEHLLEQLQPPARVRSAGQEAPDAGAYERAPSVLQAHLRSLHTFATRETLVDPCVICLDAMSCGQRVARLPCGHCFHSACATEWLAGGCLMCPLCKRSLASRTSTVAPDFRTWAT